MSTLRARTAALLFALITLAACGGGGGFGADGGVSGTGISAITGNVAAVTGGAGEVGGIQVSVAGTDITTVTAADGSFTLTGELEGPVTLRFERDDGIRAETTVDVPAGGSVDLQDVTLDVDRQEAEPARRVVTFEGLVDAVDCPGRRLRVVSRFAQGGQVFAIRLESAFVHDRNGDPVDCEDVPAGARVNVTGVLLDDGTIADADVEVVPPPVETPQPTRTPDRTRTPPPDATPTAIETRPGRTPGDVAPTRTAGVTTPPSARPTATVRPEPTATPRVTDRPAPLATPVRRTS